MSIFRCAACGSKNVSTDTKFAGITYNYVKGTVGTALLGVGGAAAGISNKEQTVYKCSDCGITLSYPMPEEIKKLIDTGVDFPDRRDSLYIQGSFMPWSLLKEKYKNIEFGYADKVLEERSTEEKKEELQGITLLKEWGTASKNEFEESFNFIHSHSDIYTWSSTKDNTLSLSEYISTLSALKIFIQNFYRFITPPVLPPEEISNFRYHSKEDRVFYRFLGPYLALDYYEATGKYPITKGDNHSFNDYIVNNPFYIELLKLSVKYGYISCMDKKKTIHAIETGDLSFVFHALFLPPRTHYALVFTFPYSDGNTIIFPKYRVKDRIIFFNNLSFIFYDNYKDCENIDISPFKKEFFKYYPELKKKYDSAISAHNTSIAHAESEKERVFRRKSEIETVITEANGIISDSNKEIEQLRKKVFGKKKAEERIQDLELLIKEQKAVIEKERSEYSRLGTISIPEPESDTAFYSRLNKAFGYYLVWFRSNSK